MLTTTLPPLRPEVVVCAIWACEVSERIGVHSRKERRHMCHACGKTLFEIHATPLFRLKYPVWVVLLVLGLLARARAIPTVAFAFGLDERTEADW